MPSGAQLVFVLLAIFATRCPEPPFWRGSFLPGGQEKREEGAHIAMPPGTPRLPWEDLVSPYQIAATRGRCAELLTPGL